MEKATCACKGKNLGKFIQPIILTIVSQGGVTGYRIAREVARFSTFRGTSPDPTGVYRYLKGMEEKDLICNTAGPEDDSCYVLTEHGRWCLENWKGTLRNYIASLELLCEEIETYQPEG